MTEEERLLVRAQMTRTSALNAGASVEIAESAARLAGILNKDIRFYNSPAQNGSLTNGYTENGVIYLNAAAVNKPVVWVTAHELTHNTENSGAYKGLLKLAKQACGDSWEQTVRERVLAAEQAAQNLGNEKLRLTAERCRSCLM